MCDTFVVVRPGQVLFGKNSDRDPNEAQVLCWHPAREYPAGASLRCTWIEIPQARHTHAVVLSRPFWMWGAEMGANEHGVVIGNEAVFTREPKRDRGLLGMDLVRLGLERGASALEARDVIIGLLQRHGQGGRCGYERPGFSYHNSFLVADAGGAWVIEAAGEHVATQRIDRGCFAISNGLTLAELRPREDRLRPRVAMADRRRLRVQCLAADAGDAAAAMRVLRDHGPDNDAPRYSRINGAMSAPCMHAGGWIAASQTVGSLVSELTPGGHRHWASGTSAPCLSVFRPLSVHAPRAVGRPTGTPGDSLWWNFEVLHRALLASDPATVARYIAERDRVQALALADDDADAWPAADRLIQDWRQQLPPQADTRPGYLRRYWRRTQRAAAGGSRLPWRDA